MSNIPPPADRIWELMAERATQGLSDADARELAQLCRDHPDVDPLAFEEAAAAMSLVFLESEPMPESVKQQLAAAAQEFTAGRAPIPHPEEEDQAPIATIGRKRGVLYAGWIAAAACLALALVGWWSAISPRIPMAQQRLAMMTSPDAKKLDWTPWDAPEIKGVTGDVVWNEKEQKGFMRFTNLRPNDPTKEQYQLWIVDERGMEQRISGALFDVSSTGEVVVPITPQIHTKGAAAFAVTIEEPGGVWVSSMKRRVVIAAAPKG